MGYASAVSIRLQLERSTRHLSGDSGLLRASPQRPAEVVSNLGRRFFGREPSATTFNVKPYPVDSGLGQASTSSLSRFTSDPKQAAKRTPSNRRWKLGMGTVHSLLFGLVIPDQGRDLDVLEGFSRPPMVYDLGFKKDR